jgi:hypothetical protein
MNDGMSEGNQDLLIWELFLIHGSRRNNRKSSNDIIDSRHELLSAELHPLFLEAKERKRRKSHAMDQQKKQTSALVMMKI